MTLTNRIIRFLTEGLRMKELPSGSKHYRKFEGKHIGSFYWVFSHTSPIWAGKTLTTSINLTGKVHANMKLWEQLTHQPI